MDSSRIPLRAYQRSASSTISSIRNKSSTACADQASDAQTCNALKLDGSRSHAPVLQPKHKLCPRHHKELRKMKDAYKSKELLSKSIGEDRQYEQNEQQIRALITIKEEIVKLRGQVQLRFFSRAADNLGHAQRILVLRAGIRDLEKHLVQRDISLGISADPPVPPNK